MPVDVDVEEDVAAEEAVEEVEVEEEGAELVDCSCGGVDTLLSFYAPRQVHHLHLHRSQLLLTRTQLQTLSKMYGLSARKCDGSNMLTPIHRRGVVRLWFFRAGSTPYLAQALGLQLQVQADPWCRV